MRYSFWGLFVLLLILVSCQKKQNKYIRHEKGFEYLFFQENKNAPKPNVGDIMILDMDYYFNDDSLLFSSKELESAFRMKLKRKTPSGETIDDALSLLHIGDSASFRVNANLFYAITKKQSIPLNIKQSDYITFYIKLKNTISFEQFRKSQKKEENDTPEQEQKLLKHYLEISNTSTKPLNSGLYFIEETPGTGPKIKKGQQITVHYSGYFVNGKLFSSSYEMGKPSTFTLGKDDLISGFEEGLSLMQKGGRYTLIIPSSLAYGQEGNEHIPPNKTLIFEIEVLDIK
jgi:FKBP-type peptidyl-prolyl cis-trans isomerase